MCGDVESASHFLLSQEFDGLVDHNLSQAFLLQAISVSKNYDIICLSETSLDPWIDSSDEKITVEDIISCVQVIQLSKMWEVRIYYKEHLPVMKRDDLCNLNECLVLEVRIAGEKNFFFMFM